MQLAASFTLAGGISRGDAAAFETRLVGAIIVLLVLLMGVRALRSYDLKRRKSRSLGFHNSEDGHHWHQADEPSRLAEQEVSVNRSLCPSFVSSRRRRGWRGARSDRVVPAPVSSTLWVAHGFAVDGVPVPDGAGAKGSGPPEAGSPRLPRTRAPQRSRGPQRSPAPTAPPLASSLPRLDLPPPPQGPPPPGQRQSGGQPG
jgi:hypothetical protein